MFTILIPPYVVKEGLAIMPNKAMLPVGPLSLASAISNRGHEVKVLDLVFQPHWQEALEVVDVNDHLLLSCHTVRNIVPCRAVLTALRARGFRGHVTLGGNACLELGQAEFAARGLEVDAVLRGYAHGTIDKIETLARGDLWPTEFSAALLPPAMDLLDEETRRKYLTASGGRYPIIGHGYGCAWSCSYCTAKMGAGWGARPLKEVEAELALATSLGFTHLWCVDNLILSNPDRTLAFDRMVQAAGLTWSGMDRAEQVAGRGGLLKRLKALTNLAIGVETVSRLQLTTFNRRDRPADYPKAFKATRAAGVSTTAFVMLDCPETDENDFWAMYHWLKESLRPVEVSWSFFLPPKNGGGFYDWPRGCSNTPQERVVQQAMLLDGVWQRGWTLVEDNPLFEDETGFGVVFEEGRVLQFHAARSPIGDIWEVWEEES